MRRVRNEEGHQHHKGETTVITRREGYLSKVTGKRISCASVGRDTCWWPSRKLRIRVQQNSCEVFSSLSFSLPRPPRPVGYFAQGFVLFNVDEQLH
jgi:hypothetical protein